jgi:hypothetical protein
MTLGRGRFERRFKLIDNLQCLRHFLAFLYADLAPWPRYYSVPTGALFDFVIVFGTGRLLPDELAGN